MWVKNISRMDPMGSFSDFFEAPKIPNPKIHSLSELNLKVWEGVDF